MIFLELVVQGVFSIIRLLLTIVIFVWLWSSMSRSMSRVFGMRWGQPEGALNPFDPRRLLCRHPVSWRGPGTYGRWSMWCERCGKEVRGR